MPASLATLVKYCDRLLEPALFTDYDRAHNGLQVENRGSVTRIAAAVDASLTTVRKAAEAGANLMVVHHGLFWSSTVPWVGRRYELIRELMLADMAIYSMHLPLDAHPKLGNAAQLARALALTRLKPFFTHKGRQVGIQAETRISRDDLAHRLSVILGRPPTVLPGGGPECRRIGICTGGAGAEMGLALEEGVDAFITGEGPHWTFAMAEDLGLNVFYGGHYATETFGVKALAKDLSRRFKLPWEFIDHPSGL
ncbi:MAG TPA: Nif3-like dinuclear metal center hexameric protein [Candidatus Limnocylindria bacterium]|jgi:dinuclear metal center YbgI/SA1388 family protein|nr:Nif3-like dinuclear metal center hexameric protein [Candidatus Limnocylindria bacterium]